MGSHIEDVARELLSYPDFVIRLLDSLPVAVFAVSSDGRIRYANSRAELLTGMPRARLFELSSVDELLPEELRARHRSEHRPAFMRSPSERPMGAAAAAPLLLQRADGEQVRVSIMLKPVPGPDGTLVVAVAQRV